MNQFKNLKYIVDYQKKIEDFNKEWLEAVELFGIVIRSKSFHVSLKHPKTREPCEPHDALPEIFENWQEIQAIWDRRSLIFQSIYDLVGQHLKPWQVANYLTANRNPFEAFEILREFTSEDLGEDYPEHCAALAKSLCSLAYYKESLSWAIKAHQIEQNNSHFEAILADAYFLTNHTDEASQIYQSRLSLVPPSSSDSISEMFLLTFSIGQGVLPSPIFAIQIGQQLSDLKQSDEFWKLAEAEFYYSPYFRSHYAYYLASQGEIKKSLAKLIALVQEMPWLQEASLNLKYIFDYFNQRGNQIMPEFQKSLSQKINDRGWTNEGIFNLYIQSC